MMQSLPAAVTAAAGHNYACLVHAAGSLPWRRPWTPPAPYCCQAPGEGPDNSRQGCPVAGQPRRLSSPAETRPSLCGSWNVARLHQRAMATPKRPCAATRTSCRCGPPCEVQIPIASAAFDDVPDLERQHGPLEQSRPACCPQDVVISSDGQFCLSGSWDGTLRLWDLHSGTTTRRFVGHTKDVLSVAFSVDNRQVQPAKQQTGVMGCSRCLPTSFSCMLRSCQARATRA
jgi:hypothetical protein